MFRSRTERRKKKLIKKTYKKAEELSGSQFSIAFRRFRKNKAGLIGLILTVSFFFIFIFADAIAPYQPLDQMSLVYNYIPWYQPPGNTEGATYMSTYNRISDYNFETNFLAWEGLETGWGRVNNSAEGIESRPSGSGNYSARCTDANAGQELVQDLTDPSVETLYFNNLIFWTYLEGQFATSVIVTFRFEGGATTEYVFEVDQNDTWERHRENIGVKQPIEVVFQKHTDGSGILLDDIEIKGGEYFNNLHIMGTNRQAEDVFSKIVYGTRVSLIVSIGAVIISLIIGLPLGMIAGYFRGRIDEVIMRVTDMFLTLPFYFVMILVIVLLQQNLWLDYLIIQLHWTAEIILLSVTLGLGLFGWMGITRLIRATILQVREMDYVEAARALGASDRRIMLIHILPNILAPLIVAVTFNLAVNIVAEAGLAFLGYTNDSLSSWGRELTNGFGIVTEAWWPVMFPALFIVSAVMAFNLLGDGLRDAFDPRLR